MKNQQNYYIEGSFAENITQPSITCVEIAPLAATTKTNLHAKTMKKSMEIVTKKQIHPFLDLIF